MLKASNNFSIVRKFVMLQIFLFELYSADKILIAHNKLLQQKSPINITFFSLLDSDWLKSVPINP